MGDNNKDILVLLTASHTLEIETSCVQHYYVLGCQRLISYPVYGKLHKDAFIIKFFCDVN